MRKFLKLVFFKRKQGTLGNLKQELQNCAICLEPFEPDSEIIELNCNEGHLFHFGCL